MMMEGRTGRCSNISSWRGARPWHSIPVSSSSARHGDIGSLHAGLTADPCCKQRKSRGSRVRSPDTASAAVFVFFDNLDSDCKLLTNQQHKAQIFLLNDLVSPKSKILVVTVLGVQSTGKSTLLNTMFGVQFAVSSGRCTRGAFMLLIRINEDVKKELNCDFMVIIDTEGLKSPELAQLDDSHEHDNELATLVVGLSNITIINIAMENSTEMKDILQIVVHAFLRMKEVGKKPKCQFVHQNVSDVSAHEKNLRDRKLLLQQLNEMTQAAAKMEKKEENKSFTDVMEYSPDTGNCYIPGLWNGNPPMAPVNAGKMKKSKTEEVIVEWTTGGQSTLLSSSTGKQLSVSTIIKFLGIHITSDLTWSMNTAHLVKKAQQRLFFLRKTETCWTLPSAPDKILQSHNKEHLSATVWYGSCTAQDRKDLAWVVKMAQGNAGSPLADLNSIYAGWIQKKTQQTQLESVLEDLGLEQHYTQKLSLSTVLQIDEKTITDESAKCNSDLPWYFLKKLMMVNVTARNVKCTSEMALKMSVCQFSVPLLLPNCDTNQCTLMLWALRDIVKKYRPQSLSESKGFIEDRIVLSELPMISFVRLGDCSLSKSEIINKLLSNSQQYHDTFIHSNMECGDSPRRISNGLAEITWYLPCGNKNMDVFSEPVAVANLRGDVASFEQQFAFLCHTSAAVFVFFDNLDSECKVLTNQQHKAQIFLVGNQQSQSFSRDALKKVATKLGLNTGNILLKTKHMNDGDFVKSLRKTISSVIDNSKVKMGIEQMANIAHELGILVDEDCAECQTAKENADAITAEIQDILKYKEAQLPLQGQIWKELTRLEKEEFRLQNVGSENIEMYKSDLQLRKRERRLREKQYSYDMSKAMTCFIKAISSPGIERCYFLKWMRMNLDNLSREKLSDLREQYKEKCKDSEKKEEIKEIDKKLSNSSLGIEHFFREMGQIYEASLSLPETDPSHQQLQHLPRVCAGLLLDGFPLELVDGDASNIPLRWVGDVLSQLNDLVSPKSKILVVTVLGVQSTGKSTLLNTMFGVQFAVSSGRCTRGAFMLLIRINEDVKKELNCDFMVIIDTEGLKSPELAQLDDSHEHDNELATLVVGLSNITIINIAMENSTEMKDILQIVVHAFLRMKEVGKKPKCQFVHQNVSDVSAHEKNLRDRKLLLQQLNEMTQAAAKMEKKEENKSFTDVMEYSPDSGNCYIPGLWNGNPPMAPVNAGYKWITSLWNAVKHENFIFSFRNSLVADAYMRLCTEFNKWEWEFKKEICLMANKENFRSGFKDVFHERDQCQKKAEEFTNRCLRPAVEDFVKRSLGPDIIDEMLKNKQFSNRIECQYSILLDLLTQNDFEKMSQLEDQRLQSSISGINDAINKAKTENSGNMKTFVEDVCQELGDKLVISQDALGAFMILNNADQPQNELFNKLIGCDWHITPDGSLQASDYWKYVLAKFNNKFAKEYNAQPADIPSSWKDIKHQQAEASLKESFNIKKGRSMRGRCNVVWVAVVAGGLDEPNPWTKTLAIGTWNVTSLGGKEPELLCGRLRGTG
ncbi:hypothetical protein L3Q82_004098 [Scortum barcoo]|uniref:Uncharacterized protein n=1 Tax=Scortum barcoo TaxID=214431 RepID=A0ACB8X6Z5_9TELE|nr:hypothetical protein L3Q82_004098 [Scortum barcoo]